MIKNQNSFYEYEEIKDTKKNKELISYIKSTHALHKYFKEDWGKLKAKQYCGILNFYGEDFYILPKIVNHNNETNLNTFIYMLRYTYDIKLHNKQTANSKNEKQENILEVFIQLFAKNLFKEFQRGTYKNYITEQDNLTTLKRKYLINENLKYLNSTDKSIATIDIALRRRFTFLKMKPNSNLVKDTNAKELMEKLNIEIEKRLGEDYELGHSYFMGEDIDLKFIKEYKIKPLLEEYFYTEDKMPQEITSLLENS